MRNLQYLFRIEQRRAVPQLREGPETPLHAVQVARRRVGGRPVARALPRIVRRRGTGGGDTLLARNQIRQVGLRSLIGSPLCRRRL